MNKSRVECLLVESIDLIDTLFHNSKEYMKKYNSTYECLKENLEFDDCELDEIDVNMELLKAETTP